jgi:hypothetical protein
MKEDVPSPLSEVESKLDSLFFPEEPISLTEGNLTPQMVLFCHLLCSGFKDTVAAKKAGYRTAAAARYLLSNPHVQKEIEARRSAMVMSTSIEKEMILSELLRILNELPRDNHGTALRLKTLEMLSKVQGFYSPDTMIQLSDKIQNISIQIVKPENKGGEDGA